MAMGRHGLEKKSWRHVREQLVAAGYDLSDYRQSAP